MTARASVFVSLFSAVQVGRIDAKVAPGSRATEDVRLTR